MAIFELILIKFDQKVAGMVLNESDLKQLSSFVRAVLDSETCIEGEAERKIWTLCYFTTFFHI